MQSKPSHTRSNLGRENYNWLLHSQQPASSCIQLLANNNLAVVHAGLQSCPVVIRSSSNRAHTHTHTHSYKIAISHWSHSTCRAR